MDIIPAAVITHARLRARFEHIHESLFRAGASLEREGLLLELIAALLSYHPRADTTPRRDRKERKAVRRVAEFLRAHYARNVRLEEIAALTDLSQWRLHRVFSQELGIPPHAYQTQLRVTRAKSLLVDGCAIAEVAAETGFADQAHLTRQFKQIVGVTPGRYARGGKNVQDRGA